MTSHLSPGGQYCFSYSINMHLFIEEILKLEDMYSFST